MTTCPTSVCYSSSSPIILDQITTTNGDPCLVLCDSISILKNPDRMKPTVHSTISLSQSRVSGRSLFQIVNHMHIATCQRRKTKTVVTSSRRLHSKAKASFIPGHVWSNFFLSSTTNYKNTIQIFTVRFLFKRLELDRTTCSHQREYFPLTSLGTDEPIMIGLARTNCNLVALYTK